MSFLKITDPAKRDLLVQELIKTRKNILQDSIDGRVGEIIAQQSLLKLFKPLTEKIETTIQAIKALPQQPALPAIQAAPPLAALAPPLVQAPPLAKASIATPLASDVLQATTSTTELGEIATAYFKRFTTKTKDADTTYGIHDRGGKFYIGDLEIKIDGNDVVVGDKVYEGTPGLWELIVSKKPSDEIYTLSDDEKYIYILTSTNALRRNNDRNETYPKSSRSPQWMKLLKPIWSKYSRASELSRGIARQHTGSSVNKGLAEQVTFSRVPIILPSNPTASLDRLDVLLASHRAGNTSVRTKIVSICDELRRQGVVDDSKYKYLVNLI
jgi:hypothetical protein